MGVGAGKRNLLLVSVVLALLAAGGAWYFGWMGGAPPQEAGFDVETNPFKAAYKNPFGEGSR